MRDPVRQQAASAPDATALVDAATGDEWTYREYDDRVAATAARLAGLGVDTGDHVALLSETRPAVARVVFACWRLGAVAVPLNARLADPELDDQLSAVDPGVVVAEPPEADRARDLATTPVAVVGDAAAPDSLAAVSPADVEPVDSGRDSDVAALFTSGTTGAPKAVRLTAGNFLAAASASAFRLGVLPDDRWLCPLSTYHMGGLAILVRCAVYGTTAVLQRTRGGFDATATREALREYDCTGVSVVPVTLRRLLDDGPLADSLRFVLCGGAPTPPQLVERCADRGVPVCQTYGMTETCSQVATPTPAEAAAHPETVGRPLSVVDLTLVDDAGDPVPRGEPGEVVVDGPTVTPGYLAGSGEFGPHGFHTGDVGVRDDAGRLRVLNRREDRILTGGENVHPGEVADALRAHPGVADVAVLGLADEEWGERVAALVVPAGAGELDAADVTSFARARLADYKVPKTVAFTDALPRTASGTVDRAAARDELHRRTDL